MEIAALQKTYHTISYTALSSKCEFFNWQACRPYPDLSHSIVFLVSLAASFSPLSSNIYFPALDLIADDLQTSNATFALSVSIYMYDMLSPMMSELTDSRVAQGLAPSFWGPLADNIGRRQVLIYTLLLYLAANLGLALTSNFPLLMVFRFLQATGSSSTISIGQSNHD